MKKPKIALALGGGTARGLAHIGVIKVLEKNKIPIDLITGTSIGAVIGSLYAHNKNIQELEYLALTTTNTKMMGLIDLSFHSGLLSGKKIMAFIKKHVQNTNFKDLKIPMVIVSTNLGTGESVYFNKGNLMTAIRASISIPLVFSPVIHKKRVLVDGHLSEPVPVNAALENGADIVIAVNLDSEKKIKSNPEPSMREVVNKTTKILLYQLSKSNSDKADVVISPGIDYMNVVSFSDAKKFIKKGELATQRVIPKIKKIIQAHKDSKRKTS